MRVSPIVAGLALVVAACGGTKGATSGDSNKVAVAPTTAPAATGTNHDIQMVQDGANGYKFMPDTLTIKAGDQVTFKGVSGNGHDVSFIADSIPPGAKDILNAAITDKSSDLSTAMIADNQSVTISFAGAPAGDYHFFCIPHAPMGMRGKITVIQ
jgi:plastocyanin